MAYHTLTPYNFLLLFQGRTVRWGQSWSRTQMSRQPGPPPPCGRGGLRGFPRVCWPPRLRPVQPARPAEIPWPRGLPGHAREGRHRARRPETRRQECGSGRRGVCSGEGPGAGRIHVREPHGPFSCAQADRPCCLAEGLGAGTATGFRAGPRAGHCARDLHQLLQAPTAWAASIPAVWVRTPRVTATERFYLSPIGGQSQRHDARTPASSTLGHPSPPHLFAQVRPRPWAFSEDGGTNSGSRM